MSCWTSGNAGFWAARGFGVCAAKFWLRSFSPSVQANMVSHSITMHRGQYAVRVDLIVHRIYNTSTVVPLVVRHCVLCSGDSSYELSG